MLAVGHSSLESIYPHEFQWRLVILFSCSLNYHIITSCLRSYLPILQHSHTWKRWFGALFQRKYLFWVGKRVWQLIVSYSQNEEDGTGVSAGGSCSHIIKTWKYYDVTFIQVTKKTATKSICFCSEKHFWSSQQTQNLLLKANLYWRTFKTTLSTDHYSLISFYLKSFHLSLVHILQGLYFKQGNVNLV